MWTKIAGSDDRFPQIADSETIDSFFERNYKNKNAMLSWRHDEGRVVVVEWLDGEQVRAEYKKSV